ncbi:MAG: hypothetical protein NTV99_09215 [Deltaproteobacteria bacterium]|nr:hypothetical protein [Deltaproteobacteria bacterium]
MYRQIQIIPLDRYDTEPRAGDRVDTRGWLRPKLLGHKAVIPVVRAGHDGLWQTLWEKRKK